MRCPECQQRNSVAASKCKFCGAKFKRKQMARGKKIALLVCFGVLGLSIYLAFALPKMVDPSERLMSAAKRIAGGAKTSEDAKVSIETFDKALKELLLKFGNDNSSMLSKRLKSCLPGTAFEVLVVDLPKGLKLVEVDTVLQATDFLVMKGTNDTRVIPLPGFEVYDDARSVSDQAGAVIVLVGHSSGQPPHKPIVQTLALLPDSIVDETANMVPAMAGEGTAKFAKDSTDINLELSLPSIAQSEKIAMNPPLTQDKIMRTKLQWKVETAKYVPSTEFPQDLPSRILLLARSLKHPEFAGSAGAILGPEGSKLVKEHAATDLQDMSVHRGEDKHKSTFYTIASSKKKIDLEFKKAGTSWQLAGYTVTALAAPPAEVAISKPGVGPGTTAGTTTGADHGTVAGGNPNLVASVPTGTGTEQTTAASGNTGAKKNDGGENKSASTKIPAGTEPNPGVQKKSTDGDILGGLTPERAGSHIEKPAVPSGKTPGAKGSSWLEDEKGDQEEQKSDHKTPVAMLPPGGKNATTEKDKKERDKKDRDKKDREKQDREKAEKDKAEKAKKSTETASSGGAKIAGDPGTGSVRLRSGPGLTTHTMDEIPKGTKIQIIGKKKGWYKVNYGGKIGYVFSPLVEAKGGISADNAPEKRSPREEAAPKATTKPASESGSKTTGHAPPATTSSGVVVHVMTLRDDNRKAISSVKVGERVVVLSGLKNHRYKIRRSDGSVGWVAREALDVKVETPPEFVP